MQRIFNGLLHGIVTYDIRLYIEFDYNMYIDFKLIYTILVSNTELMIR